jgi:hypothetical protein
MGSGDTAPRILNLDAMDVSSHHGLRTRRERTPGTNSIGLSTGHRAGMDAIVKKVSCSCRAALSLFTILTELSHSLLNSNISKKPAHRNK